MSIQVYTFSLWLARETESFLAQGESEENFPALQSVHRLKYGSRKRRKPAFWIKVISWWCERPYHISLLFFRILGFKQTDHFPHWIGIGFVYFCMACKIMIIICICYISFRTFRQASVTPPSLLVALHAVIRIIVQSTLSNVHVTAHRTRKTSSKW